MLNRTAILISVEKAKYSSQFNSQCFNVMLEVIIVVYSDPKVSQGTPFMHMQLVEWMLRDSVYVAVVNSIHHI